MITDEHETYERLRIQSALVVVLEAAQEGGMPAERAEAICEDICHCYSQMRDGFCPVLAQELRRCLAMRDRELDEERV